MAGGWSGEEHRGVGIKVGRRSRAGKYRWRAEWRGARDVGWALSWADGAALGSTDGGRSGEERSGEDSQLCGQTEPRWNLQMVGGVERRGEDS